MKALAIIATLLSSLVLSSVSHAAPPAGDVPQDPTCEYKARDGSCLPPPE